MASGLTDFFKKMSKIRKENLSLSRQEVPEIIFDRFLVVVFATRVSTESNVSLSLGAGEELHWRLDPSKFEREKEYLY